jgi:hypothetical protein
MKVPLKAAAWLTPRASPVGSEGKASVRMAAELAISMAAPTAWKIRMTMSQIPAACPVGPGDGEQQGEEGEDGEAQVVDPDPAVDVAQPAQGDHQHAGHHQEAEDHPQQVEGVPRLERIDPDPPEDVGQGDEDDGAVDRGHEHPQGGDEERRPLVARCPGRGRPGGSALVARSTDGSVIVPPGIRRTLT